MEVLISIYYQTKNSYIFHILDITTLDLWVVSLSLSLSLV